jgi:hypothetical protein
MVHELKDVQQKALAIVLSIWKKKTVQEISYIIPDLTEKQIRYTMKRYYANPTDYLQAMHERWSKQRMIHELRSAHDKWAKRHQNKKTFDLSDSFCCHKNTHMLMHPEAAQEKMSAYSYDTLWATVIMFKKSNRAKQIFETLEMVQDNYDHYANIHSFVGGIYRNDYGLTIALKIVNGHTDVPSDYIPWSLVHVGKNTSVYADTSDTQIPPSKDLWDFNTAFTIMFDHWKKSKVRKEYMTIKDMDIHIMNKDLFVEIMNG